MTYLSSGIDERLGQVLFVENQLLPKWQGDHFVIEKSQDQMQEKIRQIIASVGFCPFISPNKINGNFVFTIVPYKIPDFFLEKQGISEFSDDIHIPSELKIAEERVFYFNIKEISDLLKKTLFIDHQKGPLPEDEWSPVNNFRKFVLPALNKGLSDLILQNTREASSIVEIGSGIGYSLPESLSSRIVRVQPSIKECRLLRKSISAPIYQTDIEGLHESLVRSQKKIALFFALHVFDCMSPQVRKQSLFQLSQLQSMGDRILIMLDTNPHFDTIIQHLKDLHPDHVPFPYFPLTNKSSKQSLILIPSNQISVKPSISQLEEIIQQESNLCTRGRVSQTQQWTHQLKDRLNLKVIVLEDFFVEQAKADLEQIGYKVHVRYHASFSTGRTLKGTCEIKQDLVYKSVTDTCTVKQWAVTDPNLIESLAKKNLKLPTDFTASFLHDLKKKNQKIFGAEFLVIEATKN